MYRLLDGINEILDGMNCKYLISSNQERCCINKCIILRKYSAYWNYMYIILRIVMSDTIITQQRCSIHLYLQLFVGKLMSYLRWLCLFAHSGVQHILCCVFPLFVSSMLVIYVVSVSGLSIFDFPFGFL
jgi:hypothetical protein